MKTSNLVIEKTELGCLIVYVLYRITEKGIQEIGSFRGKIQALSGDGKIYFWGGNLYEMFGNENFDTNLVLEYYDVDKKDYVKTRQIEGKTIIADRKVRVYKEKEDVITGAPLEEADIAKRSEGKLIKIIDSNEKFKVLNAESKDTVQICTEDGKTGWIGGFHMVWD